MKLQFFPVDVDYVIQNSKAIIRLFGRSVDGRQICVIDDSFEPYFYATGNPDINEVLQIKEAEFSVVCVDKVKKKLNESEIDALKIIVNMPKAVPVLKDKVMKIPGIKRVFEFDILFARRYLIDKKLTPLLKTEIECEEISFELRVQTFRITKILSQSEEVLEPKILAVDIETYNPDNKLDSRKNPILMIGLYGKDFAKVITWKKFPTADSCYEFAPTEADAILRFNELVAEYSPDLLVGYFSDGFDLPYIVERAKISKVALDFGLDNGSIEIRGKTQREARIVGIAHLDILKFIQRAVRTLKTDDYSLGAVAMELLGEGKHNVDMDKFASEWDNGNIEEYCKYNLQDCRITYKIAEKVLPNLIEFVRIICLPPYDINRMSFSLFVEWYLMRQASARNEIILNKPSHHEESDRMADRIQGAFVYEPKPGFYKSVVVFDFRSLYPSIIASHNISKGTLNCLCCKSDEIKTERGVFWYCKNKKGLFSAVIFDLILRRNEVKKLLKADKQPTTNNLLQTTYQLKDPLLAARSEALKVLANSFYGYMAFAPARWYCIECAESTTALARYYIHKAINSAETAGFTVLYSDTDSIFLLLDKKTKEDAFAWMEQINKLLPGLVELDFEGFYPAGIFVSLKAGEGGAKKKYALIDEKGSMKIRGFETIRRNWSVIAKEVQAKVLDVILREHDPKKAKAYVRSVIDDLRRNILPVESVVITTALSKSTESYASIGPHVAAAQRMEAKGQLVGNGTIIEYVVVKGKGKIRDKVRLPSEVKQDDYDGEYYIQNQIIPGVEKIFSALDVSVDDLVSTTKQSSLSGF